MEIEDLVVKPLILANWKMTPPTYKEAEGLFLSVRDGIKKIRGVDVVLCPPFVWLTDLSHKPKEKIALGAQDVFWDNRGAYTGEISPLMLRSAGVKYVIVGHSERRLYLGESDEMVNKKVKSALQNGFKTVLCVGERQRLGDEIPAVVGEQLHNALRGVKENLIEGLIIAYEPVWAISTMPGSYPDTPDKAFRAKVFIRKIVVDLYGRRIGGGVRIVYGGSVNSKNILSFLTEGNMEGALVGGASLNPTEFIKIVKIAASVSKR